MNGAIAAHGQQGNGGEAIEGGVPFQALLKLEAGGAQALVLQFKLDLVDVQILDETGLIGGHLRQQLRLLPRPLARPLPRSLSRPGSALALLAEDRFGRAAQGGGPFLGQRVREGR